MKLPRSFRIVLSVLGFSWIINGPPLQHATLWQKISRVFHHSFITLCICWTLLGWLLNTGWHIASGSFPGIVGFLEISLTQLPMLFPVPILLTSTTVFGYFFSLNLFRSNWVEHIQGLRSKAYKAAALVNTSHSSTLKTCHLSNRELEQRWRRTSFLKQVALGTLTLDSSPVLSPAAISSTDSSAGIELPELKLTPLAGPSPSEDTAPAVVAWGQRSTHRSTGKRRSAGVEGGHHATPYEAPAACKAYLRRSDRLWSVFLLCLPALFAVGGVVSNFQLARLVGVDFVALFGLPSVVVDTIITAVAYFVHFLALCCTPVLIATASNALTIRLGAFSEQVRIFGLKGWATEGQNSSFARELETQCVNKAERLMNDFQSIADDIRQTAEKTQIYVSVSTLLGVSALLCFFVSTAFLGMDVFVLHAVRLTYCAIFMSPVVLLLVSLSRVHAALAEVNRTCLTIPLGFTTVQGVSNLWSFFLGVESQQGRAWVLAGRDLSLSLVVNALYLIGLTVMTIFQFTS